MIRVLISILTYNGGDKTIKTVSDVLSQRIEDIDINVIVIDNCSTNGIADKIKSEFPQLEVITTNNNFGFSGGNNIAIERALKSDADFLFILNDDIEIIPYYVHQLVNVGISRPDAAALGSTIRLPNGKIQAVCGYLKPWQVGVCWSNVKCDLINISVRKVDVIQGAAFALTKTALQKGFKFDDCLFFGGEEYDMGCWAKSVSLKIYVLEHLEVIHNTNQDQVILNRWHPDELNYYYGIRNYIYLKQKYSKSLIMLIISICYTSMRNIFKGFIFFLKGNTTMMKYILRGIYDGITKRMGQYSYLDRHVS